MPKIDQGLGPHSGAEAGLSQIPNGWGVAGQILYQQKPQRSGFGEAEAAVNNTPTHLASKEAYLHAQMSVLTACSPPPHHHNNKKHHWPAKVPHTETSIPSQHSRVKHSNTEIVTLPKQTPKQGCTSTPVESAADTGTAVIAQQLCCAAAKLLNNASSPLAAAADVTYIEGTL